MKILSCSIICFSLLSTFLVCQEETDEYKVLLETLQSLDAEKVLQINDRLKKPVTAICNILREGSDAEKEKIASQLSHVFASWWRSAATENTKMQEFMSKELIPNHIPNRFICGWMVIVERLEKVFKWEGMQFGGFSRDKIFEKADERATDIEELQKRQMMKERTLTKSEFIVLLEIYAEKLDKSLIENLGNHTMCEYFFRHGKRTYYEAVFIGYTQWLDYFNQGTSFGQEIIKELQEKYGTNWETHRQSFALLLSRDHFLGNNVKHEFWLLYQNEISENLVQKDFEEILDSAYTHGWFYTKNSVDYFNLMAKSWQKIHINQRTQTLQFEPLLRDSTEEVGLPQSVACSFTKKKWKYFFRKWSSASGISTLPKENR